MFSLQHAIPDEKHNDTPCHSKRRNGDAKDREDRLTKNGERSDNEKRKEGALNGNASASLLIHTVSKTKENWRVGDRIHDREETSDGADQATLTAVSAPGIPDYPHRMLQTYCDIPHWRDLGTEAP